jgi:hypothetical protein
MKVVLVPKPALIVVTPLHVESSSLVMPIQYWATALSLSDCNPSFEGVTHFCDYRIQKTLTMQDFS